MKKIIVFSLFLLTCQFAFSQQWEQLGADIDGEAAGDLAGLSLGLNGDGSIMAIGSLGHGGGIGHTRVYQWNGVIWDQLGQNIDGEAAGDNSGSSVSLSADGSRIAIGATFNDGNTGNPNDNRGHVRIFGFNGADWIQIGQDIDGEAAGDLSGYASLSLSPDGNRVVIGGYFNDGNGTESGHVRVFELQGGNWVQLGDDIDGEAPFDRIGRTLSMSDDGNRIAAGAPWNDGNGNYSGHVRVYQWNGASWNQLGSDLDGAAAGDFMGTGVSLSSDGNIVAIGASQANGSNSGYAQVYQWNGVTWNQIGQDINGEASEDDFGSSVSLSSDGTIVAIGGYFNNGGGADSGHVQVYQWDGANWNQIGQDIDGEAAGDRSGVAVSLNDNGNTVAIGAYWNDGNGANSGHVRAYWLAPPPDPDTALGEGSGANSTGEGNVFVGYQSGFNTTDGNFNTFVGSESGYSNQNGSGNVFLGHQAGYNEAGSNLLYIDNSDTDSPLIRGDFENDLLRFNGSISIDSIPQDDSLARVLVADNDGYVNWRDAASIAPPDDFASYPESAGDGGGITNAYFGHNAGLLNTGTNNTFVGSGNGASNTTGNNNTALGYDTLASNQNGENNTAVGTQALALNTSGANNTALGYQSLLSNQTGWSNVAIGEGALFANLAGSNNLAIGYRALFGNVWGDNNIAIGNNATTTVNNLFNTIAIGNGALTTASDQVRIGNDQVTSIGGYAPWSNLSDGRFKKDIVEDIPGLDFITKLRPVSYSIDRPKLRKFFKREGSQLSKTPATDSQRRSIGFVAQEVAQILEENDYASVGVEKPQNENDHYSIRYAEFVVPLVKGMQEQQALIEAQQQRIETLESIVANIGSLSPLTNGDAPDKSVGVDGFTLHQNIPNPFNQKTSIKAVVPEGVQQAKIVVYNLNGLELESYDINSRGSVSVEISAGSFSSGMYLYALLADGRVIDTKKMILTK